MMHLRVGRHNPQNIYLHMNDDPKDRGMQIAVTTRGPDLGAKDAEWLCNAVNLWFASIRGPIASTPPARSDSQPDGG